MMEQFYLRHMTGNTSAGMTLFVAHRFNQKQIQKPINELTTPMMLFFNCLIQLLILKIVKIVNYNPEMYSLSIKETQDVMSIVGREIQLTKDYTTGNATFKQGSRGTVIEVPSRKDGKLKVKLDNDNEKTFRLIKECDLQLYEGGPLSFSSESQTAETSFEY